MVTWNGSSWGGLTQVCSVDVVLDEERQDVRRCLRRRLKLRPDGRVVAFKDMADWVGSPVKAVKDDCRL